MRTRVAVFLAFVLVGCADPPSTADGNIRDDLTSGSEGSAPRNAPVPGVTQGRFVHQVFAGELADSDPRLELRDEGARHDRYPVRLQAGDRIRVVMWSTEFDTYLYLLDPRGEPVTQDDDGTGSLNAYLEVEVDQSGTYTVVATAFGAEERGQYALFIQSSDQEMSEPLNVEGYYEDEHDAAPQGRDPPVVDRTLHEQLSTNDPADANGAHHRDFPVDLTSGDTVYVMMRSSEFDTYLELIGPNGQPIASSDDNEIAGGLNSYIVYTANATGTYQVRARSYSPGSTGSFDLLIGRHPAGSPPPEP